MSGKYPYIPKEYYPAVMFACKIIKENGYFNKAIKTASKYYQVDEEQVKKYVRERQGAGQKGKTRDYKWYVVYAAMDCLAMDDDGTFASWQYTEEDWKNNMKRIVIKATSSSNAEWAAEKKICVKYEKYYGECLRVFKTYSFETREEANKHTVAWNDLKENIPYCYGGAV